MAEGFEQILSDFNIPVPGDSGKENVAVMDNTVPRGVNDSALEQRVNSVLDGNANSNKQQGQPVAPQAPAQQQTQQQSQQQQPTSNQQQQPVDFAKQFAEGSQKAFFDDSGELNSQKVQDFFLSKGKSILKFEAPVTSAEAPKHDTVLDPEQEYRDNVQKLFVGFRHGVDQLKAQGRTEADILNIIAQQLDTYEQSKNSKIEFANARKEHEKLFEAELSEIRENKLTAKISQNYAELSDGFKGLIPGMEGSQVLDSFVLRPEYGGKLTDYLFRKENPNVDKMPEAERKPVIEKWFKNFQADKQAMSFVAEFGRAQWAIAQLPNILEHAQKVGASKATNVREARIGAPSNITAPQKSVGNSAVAQFLGYDSVN
jgi:hypothetical protein